MCFIVATKVIEEDEEVFVDYNYEVENFTAPQWNWYKEAKKEHLRKQSLLNELTL